MKSYRDHIPKYLQEHTGRNAREWERRLRDWYEDRGSLPTYHWEEVAKGSSRLGIWQLWRIQDDDPQLSMDEWKHEPAMHVLTRRTTTHGTEIVSAGFIQVTPLHIPHEDLHEISVEAREQDLRERQNRLTEPFDGETMKHINRLYAEAVREHVTISLREGDLTLLRDELCVPEVAPPTKFSHDLHDFKTKMVRRANIKKRTALKVVEGVNKDMWWPQYRSIDDERDLPSLYLARIELVNDWEPGFY